MLARSESLRTLIRCRGARIFWPSLATNFFSNAWDTACSKRSASSWTSYQASQKLSQHAFDEMMTENRPLSDSAPIVRQLYAAVFTDAYHAVLGQALQAGHGWPCDGKPVGKRGGNHGFPSASASAIAFK